jgi:hypothetical protein
MSGFFLLKPARTSQPRQASIHLKKQLITLQQAAIRFSRVRSIDRRLYKNYIQQNGPAGALHRTF